MNRFSLKSSRRYALLLSFLFACALLSIALTTLSLMLKIPLQLFCIISLAYYLYAEAWRKAENSIIELHYVGENEWLLKNNKQHTSHVSIDKPNSIVTHQIMILNFKCLERKKRSGVIILSDALSKEEWRRLKVLLFFN